MNNTLSIVSVCNEYAEYLNLNREISTKSLDIPWTWTVAFYEEPRIGSRKLHKSFEKRPFIQTKGVKVDGVAPNSTEHGENLNKLVRYVREKHNPRFLLALDPDFFIFGNLQKIINLMIEYKISVFGAPYAESSTPLFRNVPVGFCMLFDREKFDEIDFSTGYGTYPNPDLYPDIGYEMYNKIKQRDNYGMVLPIVRNDCNFLHMTKGLKELGFVYDNEPNEVGTKIDEYFHFDHDFWGIHTRGKFNQNRNKNRERIEKQLKVVRDLQKFLQ